MAPAEGAWDDAKDAWITARVRSELVLDRDIRSSNYTIDTENGSVYLIGSARSQGELYQTMRVARYVPRVKRVVLLCGDPLGRAGRRRLRRTRLIVNARRRHSELGAVSAYRGAEAVKDRPVLPHRGNPELFFVPATSRRSAPSPRRDEAARGSRPSPGCRRRRRLAGDLPKREIGGFRNAHRRPVALDL